MPNKNEWNIEKFDEVTSTNDVAKQMAGYNNDKLIIVADSQTDGRGRRGNKWISQKGNLFFSQLFVSQVNVSHLVFVSSLSLVEAIKSFFPKADITIKWPNDILLNEKKIAGILIEITDNEMIIVGIGVNMISRPEELQAIYPVANLNVLGKIDNDKFLYKYLENFDKNYIVCQNDFALIREKWLTYAARLNQKIKVKRKDNIDEGIFCGIDEQGLLLLKQDNKQVKISVAEVFF